MEANTQAGETPSRRRDLAGTWRSSFVVWGLPVAVLVVTGFLGNEVIRPIAWPLALLWMGGACLFNAVRCGRVHCHITGPFFLIMAALSLLHGLAVLPLGADGWRWIGAAILVGGVGLTYVPERLWGRYVRRR